MQKMNCLIIEDERLAAEVLQDYIHDVPGLTLAGICTDAPEAMDVLRQQTIDIIFIDIHLPRINGVDFVKTLKGNYHIIFTTAYHQYALEGFNVNAVDYLLKPVAFSRFLQAVQKVFDRSRAVESPVANAPLPSQRSFHFFNVDKKQVKVFSDEILYIESLKSYICIHLKDRKICTKFQIGELERILEADIFLRVHKSYIVNAGMITAYSAGEIEIGNIQIPIGRIYKEHAEAKLRQQHP